jgi:dinuclear metal center YbgI/SA1388 family protein
MKIKEICGYIEQLAPLHLAEDWDNVGLLIGNLDGKVERILTCLTVTPSSAEEAIERSAQLIITHHPLPFRALKQITSASTTGSLLWNLIRNDVAVFSAHTAFDSAECGINQRMAQALNLSGIRPLRARVEDESGLGAGRRGMLDTPLPMVEFASCVKAQFGVRSLRGVITSGRKVHVVGIACGSGAEFLSDAHRAECDTFITGEASFHACLEAQAIDMNLLLLGHFASERFAMEQLADDLAARFPELTVWASDREHDPITEL